MFPTCDDSDQSLSEEEDLSPDSAGRYAISFRGPLDNKGPEMQVLSELEKLRNYADQLDHGTNTTIFYESLTATEDEIEFPAFNNEDCNINHQMTASVLKIDDENIHGKTLAVASVGSSDEEILSDCEKNNFTTIGSVKRNGERDALYEANQQVEALVQLNESTSLSSREQIFIKDGQSKAKPKFLFRFHPQKESLLVVSDKSVTNMLRTEELEGDGNVYIQKSMAESLEIVNGREVELHKIAVPTESVISHDYDGNSMADFLDGLQENCDHLREGSKQPNRSRGRRRQVSFKSIAPLSSKKNDEDSLMDGRSSADDEPVLQQKTMADLFHDALGSLSPNDCVVSEVKMPAAGTGLFDKLQHVMLKEKEKDVDFLERPITDDCPNDGKGYIDVRILSRSLEAKHNVCCCAIIRHKGSSQLLNDLSMTKQIGERTLTIIFSSRICCDVELEVGNGIRIQHPWKEVKVKGKDAAILLSTYFSRIGL